MMKLKYVIFGISLIILVTLSTCSKNILPVYDSFAEETSELRLVEKYQGESQNELKLSFTPRVLQISNGTNSNSTGGGDKPDQPDDKPVEEPKGQVAIPERSKKWKSRVTMEERVKYEKMLKMKTSFQASLNFLPKNFKPEDKEYRNSVAKITLVFIVMGSLVLLLLFIYLILRFCCNKCIGPVKASQVTRFYRNFTWILMIGSLISLIMVYSFLLTYSFKINNAMNDASDLIKEDALEISTNHVYSLQNLTNSLQGKAQAIDQDNFKNLITGLDTYGNKTKNRMDISDQLEDGRNLISILIFLSYLILIGLSFLAFFKRWSNFLLGISIALLFSLPVLLFFEGVTTTYYFIYSDMCEDVHDAIYENKFPVPDKGIGYFVSCFNAPTRAALHAYSHQVDTIEYNLKYNSPTNSSSDFEINTKLQAEIKKVKNETLKPLLECNHVYDSVEFFEQRFCINAMSWANNLLTSYSWLFLIIFLSAYSINRMKPLVEKKKNELESMMINEDAIY